MKFKSAVYGVVIGMVIGNFIQSYRIYKLKKKLKKTLNSFNVISESDLRDYRNQIIDEYDKTLPKEGQNDQTRRRDLEDS